MNESAQFLMSNGGLILFATVFAEQSGLPLPALPWLLAAGALAASGRISLFTAIGCAAFGALVADAIWFYVGRRAWRGLSRRCPHLQTVLQRSPARSILRGFSSLIAAKFLPLGTIVPLRAGALHVRSVRFLLLEAFSSLFYTSLYVLLGYFFCGQLERMLAWTRGLGTISLVLQLIIAACLGYAFLKRRQPRLSESIKGQPGLEENKCVLPI